MLVFQVIYNMVSIAKLNNNIKKYSDDEIENLSGKECDAYTESLVLELFKNYKHGKIYPKDDNDVDIIDLIDSFIQQSKKKFSNTKLVLLDREHSFLFSAYQTANMKSIYYDDAIRICCLNSFITNLLHYQSRLRNLLLICYYNYSNTHLLESLFFNLCNADGMPLTFDIHNKYVDDPKFAFNKYLIDDVNIMVESVVKDFFDTFDRVEKYFDVDEITADDYFDKATDLTKDLLKTALADTTEFQKKSILNTGFDSILFDMLDNTKNEIALIKDYVKIKDWFMKLYDGNAFNEIIAFNSNKLDDFKSGADIDDGNIYAYYNLKKCELILPDNK